MMYLLSVVVWLLTALVAINIGVQALVGFDALSVIPASLRKTAGIVIAVAGILSLF